MDLAHALELQSIKEKSVLITGASSGIGRESALILAPLVREIYLTARRGERLDELKKEIGDKCRLHLLAGDIRNAGFLAEMKRAGFFDVDILINNAGLARGLHPTLSALESDWEEMLDTNIKAAFLVIKAVLPYMYQKKYGHIVNLTSVASHTAYANGGVYCASKHALLAFARSLRSETCGENIRVTNISPGMTDTEFSLVRYHGDTQKAQQVYANMTPLSGRDIARQILFCLLQPTHVNIDEIYLTPVAQGEVTKVYRPTLP